MKPRQRIETKIAVSCWTVKGFIFNSKRYEFRLQNYKLSVKVHIKDVTFHNRWNWIIAMNGYDTRIQSRSPPCCYNNKLPNLHCALKYIMYDAPKCTLQTLQKITRILIRTQLPSAPPPFSALMCSFQMESRFSCFFFSLCSAMKQLKLDIFIHSDRINIVFHESIYREYVLL